MEDYCSFSSTSIGAMHVMRGMLCQDFSLSADCEKYTMAAVADGHGSLQYLRTDTGSRLAAECAFACVDEFIESLDGAMEILNDEKKRNKLLKQLWRSIVSLWYAAIEEDFGENPFTDEEFERLPEEYAPYIEYYKAGNYTMAYGTTLAFAVITESCAFGAQIGDGKCVAINADGSASEPIPDDPLCYDNVTTSMCQDDAVDCARYFYFPKDAIPPAIFLGTDGIDKSYWSAELFHSFYKSLALVFVNNSMNDAVELLTNSLPDVSALGSGDDVSCAGIVNTERLELCADSMQEDVDTKLSAAEEYYEEFYEKPDITYMPAENIVTEIPVINSENTDDASDSDNTSKEKDEQNNDK